MKNKDKLKMWKTLLDADSFDDHSWKDTPVPELIKSHLEAFEKISMLEFTIDILQTERSQDGKEIKYLEYNLNIAMKGLADIRNKLIIWRKGTETECMREVAKMAQQTLDEITKK